MADSPVAEDGVPLHSIDGNVAPNVDSVRVRLDKGHERHLRDFIWAGSSHTFVVSHHAYDMFRRFVLDQDIGFLSAEVCTQFYEIVDRYILVHWRSWPHYTHDILDYDRAKLKYFKIPGKQIPSEVIRWVADSKKVPPADLFCTGPCITWVVTGPLHDALIAHEVTGCSFIPIEISA